MIGIRMPYGTRSARTNSGMNAVLRTSSITLAMYCEAISPQTNCGFFSNSSGPGRRPHIIRPPSMIAVVAEPGMPSVSIGTIAPVAAALLADSGPATPSIAPRPNSSGCFETFFSTAYDMKVAIVGPAPGRMPTKKPSTVPRAIAQRLRSQSTARSASHRAGRSAPGRSRAPSPRLGAGEHLAEPEQADRDRQEVDPVHHLGNAEREARIARDDVEADHREHQPEHHADVALDRRSRR